MAVLYQNGEEVRAGDVVLFGGETGRVEFVATRASEDAATRWYVDEIGEGFMVAAPSMGLVYVTDAEEDEVEFVARGAEPRSPAL